jgi:hypothetical protein
VEANFHRAPASIAGTSHIFCSRVLIALITALPLVVGVTAAQADGGPVGGWSGQAAVAGTIVSVNTATGTFVANAYVVTPPAMGTGGSGDGAGDGGGSVGGDFAAHTATPPTTTQVTITTNAATMIHVRGVEGPATVGNLAAGDRFFALFPGASTDTIQTLVANPATSIYADVPKQFYAFVGTVTGTDTTADTVTVDVMRSLPSGLIPAGTSATFTLSPATFIIGGTSLSAGSSHGPFGGFFGGSLTDVSQGDMVAGGLIGPGGLTAAQFEAGPLQFLLDLPAPPASAGTGTTTSAALTETVKLLHGGKVKLKKFHGHKSHHTSKDQARG